MQLLLPCFLPLIICLLSRGDPFAIYAPIGHKWRFLFSCQLRTIHAQYTHYSRTIPITSVAVQWESQPKTLNCRRFAPSSKLQHAARLYTLKTFKTPKTFSTQNLHIRKFCCTFATESYAGGRYVLRKAFRKGSFLGRFLTY